MEPFVKCRSVEPLVNCVSVEPLVSCVSVRVTCVLFTCAQVFRICLDVFMYIFALFLSCAHYPFSPPVVVYVFVGSWCFT